ncbi:MAG: GspE/PulE family protein [Chloroflexota bacterium]
MTEKSADERRPKLRKLLIQPEVLALVPETIARKHSVIPLEVKGNVLHLIMANPSDILAIEALEVQTQMRIEPEGGTPEEVSEAIDFNYRSYEELEKEISSFSLAGATTEVAGENIPTEMVDDAPIVKALTLIIDEAVKARASDIHIQPQEDELLVRYRIDGALQDMLTLPISTAVPLISRIKILASMNIADHHRPQDGQFSVKPKGRRDKMDIRVGIVPTVTGEMAALRLLDKARVMMTLAQLGFLPETLSRYEEMLKVPHGMLLVCGPTGSGKTTTLYASINSLDYRGRNIITIEDPVEYRFKYVNQIQVNPRAGLTFASGLRSILRLDPNVILVGEMRDGETAGIGIQSALTGHLVLSSIHANDAIGVVSRLIDLGVEPFLVASALIGVLAQRMIRRVCPDCAQLVDVPLIEQAAYERETGEKRTQFMYGQGCSSCSYTGYRGRTGIHEILHLSDAVRSLILSGASPSEIRNQAVKEGMISLMKDGMLKVKQNITTPAEVLRRAYSVE